MKCWNRRWEGEGRVDIYIFVYWLSNIIIRSIFDSFLFFISTHFIYSFAWWKTSTWLKLWVTVKLWQFCIIINFFYNRLINRDFQNKTNKKIATTKLTWPNSKHIQEIDLFVVFPTFYFLTFLFFYHIYVHHDNIYG